MTAKLREPVDCVAAADLQTAETESARKWIRDEATRRIAAMCLADQAFPFTSEMPRVQPVPWNQLGHQVLFDYDQLTRILWGATLDIRAAVRRDKWTIIAPLVAAILAASACLVGTWAVPPFGVWHILAAFVMGTTAYSILLPNVGKIATEIRSREILSLIEGVEPKSIARFTNEVRTKGPLAAWGDGQMDDERCPVLVMLDESAPFPGYGMHQARSLFVCRTQDEASQPQLLPEQLNEMVSSALIRMVRKSGVSCVSSGLVVLIDGRTLRKSSPWLGLGDEIQERYPAPPCSFRSTGSKGSSGSTTTARSASTPASRPCSPSI
jgi:hypothetical protein